MQATNAVRTQAMSIHAEPNEVAVVDLRFEDLYRREYPNLLGVARVLSGRDGEDLVQDAMVRTFVRWDKVRRLDRPGGWCHRVLINLCRNQWRRRRVEARFLASQRWQDQTTPGPSDEVLAFWEAVRSLPERPRMAVTLFYAGDRTVAEVASILDVPQGTVSSDLSRARAVLISRTET